MAPRIVITNDDGIDANGLRTLVRAVADASLDAVVVAPTVNRSGVSRSATYGSAVMVEEAGEIHGVPAFACHGSPVDCVRSALMGELAPAAELVLSGINHGPNLGDDSLNSGTVGAAVEGALLGVSAIAVSQQTSPGRFHILDALDQATPVYDETARIAALIAARVLEHRGPDRAVLNVNAPVPISDHRIEVTRLGRRFYARRSIRPVEVDGVEGYLTFGERDGPAPPFEVDPGTDFGALAAGHVSLTPLSYAWHDEAERGAATEWAQLVARASEVENPESKAEIS
jgi:5'-nucleotidase